MLTPVPQLTAGHARATLQKRAAILGRAAYAAWLSIDTTRSGQPDDCSQNDDS